MLDLGFSRSRGEALAEQTERPETDGAVLEEMAAREVAEFFLLDVLEMVHEENG